MSAPEPAGAREKRLECALRTSNEKRFNWQQRAHELEDALSAAIDIAEQHFQTESEGVKIDELKKLIKGSATALTRHARQIGGAMSAPLKPPAIWIHDETSEVFTIEPWRIGRDAPVTKYIEATPLTLAAGEMYEALQGLVDLADTAETSGGISNSDLFHARQILMNIASARKAEGR